MTDKPTSEETPVERLLREALDARASLVTAQSLRQDAPPSRRLRRLRPVLAVTVPLLGLAAGLLGYVTLGGTPVAMRQNDPAVAVTGSPRPVPTQADTSPGPSQSSGETAGDTPSSPPATAPYTFRGVTLQLPAGWTARPEDDARLCLMAPGKAAAPKGPAGCAPYGVMVAAYDSAELENVTWPSEAELDSSNGWSQRPYCAAWDDPHTIPDGAAYRRVGDAQRSAQELNGRWAARTTWQVACGDGQQFTARMWGFHKEQVFVVAGGLKADYEADLNSILGSIDVRGRGDVLKKGRAADVKATVNGLTPGSQVPNTGRTVEFSVTWTNLSTTAYRSVEPVVATEMYDGVDNPVLPMAEGTLERLDGGGWTSIPLSKGGDVGYAVQGQKAAFALAPGQSRTIRYRMSLTAKDGPGTLPVAVELYLPTAGKGTFTMVGGAVVPVQVVKG